MYVVTSVSKPPRPSATCFSAELSRSQTQKKSQTHSLNLRHMHAPTHMLAQRRRGAKAARMFVWRKRGTRRREHERSEESLASLNVGSIVWRWFGYRKEDVAQTTVICKICSKPVATKGSSTTNLFHHLKIHPLQNEECLKLCMSTSPGPTNAKAISPDANDSGFFVFQINPV